MRNIILGLIVIFLATSCLDSEKKIHIQRIDELTSQLDSLEQSYKAMPLDSFSYIRETALNNENKIKLYFSEDTIDVEFARAMNRYKAIRKGSKFIMQKRNFLDTVFTFQHSQLEKLKTDIQNGVGKRDKYATYVDAELDNQSMIIQSFNDFEKRYAFMRNEFYEINPLVEDKLKIYMERD